MSSLPIESNAGETTAGRDRVLPIAALIAIAVVLLGFDLGGWVLESNDEARFPMMARDVLVHGHWLAPEIAGTPMLNKPPLHAWLIALASLGGGEVTPRTAALPSMLAAVAVVLVTAWFASRWFGVGAGLAAGFMTATTVGVFTLARSALPDMTLTLAATAATCAFGAAELDRRPRALVVFYGLTGLAFLAKGPAGLIPLATAAAYTILLHGPRGLARLVSVPGFAVIAVLTVAWPVVALQANSHLFVHDVLTKDMEANYFGLLTWRWQRLVEPFRQAISLSLPWSVLLPVAVRAAVRDGVRRSPAAWLAIVWTATAFILVALSERQRARYYVPLCPPVAMLVAAWYDRRRFGRRATVLAGACAVVVVVAFGVGERYEMHRRDRLNDVSAMAAALRNADGPMFAVDSPELVFGYYLNRPIVPLVYYSQFERDPGHGYIIVSDPVSQTVPPSVDRLATARVNGRTFVLMKR